MRYYFLLLIIIVNNYSNLLSAEEKVIEDNLTIFNRLAKEIIGQAIVNAYIDKQSKILIKNAGIESGSDWFIESLIIESLKQADYDSINLFRNGLNVGDTSQSITICEFKIIDLSVRYKRKKNSFWKINQLERKLGVALWINIYNLSNGFVYWANHSKKEYSDTIQRNSIFAVQNNNISFTVAAIPVARVEKIIEPAFMTVLSGIIIYLFYSFRSK